MLCKGCDNEIPKNHDLKCHKCEKQICKNCGDMDSMICNICSYVLERDNILNNKANENDDDDDYDDDDYDDDYDDDWNTSKCTNCNVKLKDEANECHVCGLMLGGAPSGSIGVFGEEDFDHD